jgi:hypothetical protein
MFRRKDALPGTPREPRRTALPGRRDGPEGPSYVSSVPVALLWRWGGRWLALAAVSIAVSGCGSSVATVSGKVTFDSQPLANGTITFLPADGATATAGGKIENGTYSVQMPPGQKKVQVSATKVVGQRVVYDDPKSPVIDDVREMLPPQYHANTILTVDAKAGINKQDFDLKSKP